MNNKKLVDYLLPRWLGQLKMENKLRKIEKVVKEIVPVTRVKHFKYKRIKP